MTVAVVSRSAEISPCLQYRYLLTRSRVFGVGACTFIMLNPSTADGHADDPTIRRCLGFIEDWGYRQLRVVNLFAWRATYPRDMLKQMDPVGPDGNRWILDACSDANLVVCAWGANPARAIRTRGDAVRSMLVSAGVKLHHLGLSTDGYPRHPLFLERSTQPEEWT